MEGHDIGPEEIHLHRLGRRDSKSVKDWKVCGREVPRSELVFFSSSHHHLYRRVPLPLPISRLAEATRTCGAHC